MLLLFELPPPPPSPPPAASPGGIGALVTLLSLLSIFLATLAVDTAEEGQISPDAFMVSLCGCLATITVLHTANKRKNSCAKWLWK